MGSTSTYKPAGPLRDFMQRELFPTSGRQIIASATVSSTFYAAVKEPDSDAVWGMVVLVQYAKGRYNFTYKEMDETMGPNESECPARVLDLLTPTDSVWAQEWRARCRQHQPSTAISDGDMVVFANPVQFVDGSVHTRMRAYRSAGKLRFSDENSQFACYQISGLRNRAYTVERAK